MKKILLIEPDYLQAKAYKEKLATNFEVSWTRTSKQAIEALNRASYDLIISEINLDQHSGIELLHELKAYVDWTDIPLIFLSGLGSQAFPINQSQWQDYGVTAFLDKSSTRTSDVLKAALSVL